MSEHFGLDVEDRRVLDQHIDAFVRARAVDFSELLGLLKREELQGMCEALGLDRSGREKEPLVARILAAGSGTRDEKGPAQPTTETEPSNVAPKSKKPTKTNGGDLGFEDKLWEAADELRGNMDAAEYKHVVLGLIFLKYVSDAFEERQLQLQAEKSQGSEAGPH